MKSFKTPRKFGPVGSTLIGLVGTIVSIVVTMQVKKMLEAKGLPERSEDLKAALKKAGATATDLKETASAWIAEKAAVASDSVRGTADEVADKANHAVTTVRDKTTL